MLGLLSKKMMMALSFIFFLLTLFFSYVIMFNLDTPEKLVDTSGLKIAIVDKCKNKAINLGFTNEELKSVKLENRNSLTLKRTTVSDPMELAIKTSVLQSYCNKMELKTYCLGNDCKQNPNEESYQFNMTLIVK